MKDELEKVLSLAVTETNDAIEKVNWEDPNIFASWLAQCFYTVQHTTRFLCQLAGSFDLNRQDFHQFGLVHLKEEAGHELLAKEDLENLGFDLDIAHELPSSRKMIAEQYSIIRSTPVGHFGFFLYLETLSIQCGPELMKRLSASYSEKTLSFLKLHVEEDEKHVKIITDQLIKADPEEIEIAIKNIKGTCKLYISMLEELSIEDTAMVA